MLIKNLDKVILLFSQKKTNIIELYKMKMTIKMTN